MSEMDSRASTPLDVDCGSDSEADLQNSAKINAKSEQQR